MHAHWKRLCNVMCRDRLSALLRGCSTLKLHSMLGLQRGSIWQVKNSSWKLQMWNFSCWQCNKWTRSFLVWKMCLKPAFSLMASRGWLLWFQTEVRLYVSWWPYHWPFSSVTVSHLVIGLVFVTGRHISCSSAAWKNVVLFISAASQHEQRVSREVAAGHHRKI